MAPPLESEVGGYNRQLGLERGLKSLVAAPVAALVASLNRPFSWIARPIRGPPGRQTVVVETISPKSPFQTAAAVSLLTPFPDDRPCECDMRICI